MNTPSYYKMSLDVIKHQFRDEKTYPAIGKLDSKQINLVEYILINWKNIFVVKNVGGRQFDLRGGEWFDKNNSCGREHFHDFKNVQEYRKNCGDYACFGGFVMTDEKIFDKYMKEYQKIISNPHRNVWSDLAKDVFVSLLGHNSVPLCKPMWEDNIELLFYRLCYYYANRNMHQPFAYGDITWLLLTNCKFELSGKYPSSYY